MKNNTDGLKKRCRVLPILLLCLALLTGCAKTAGGNAGGGKTEDGGAANSAEEAPFEEKTPEQINGKDEKNGTAGQEEGSIDIVSAIKDGIFSGPEGSIPPEALRPDNDFSGLFYNDAYIATVMKGENGEMRVAIASASADPAATEWTMSGYFSDENYRIRYDDAVKSLVTYAAGGVETGRETEYENGTGTIQFSDPDHFLWDNNEEPIEKNVFRRSNPLEAG